MKKHYEYGGVVSTVTADSTAAREFADDPDFTEVQVVPLDAIVIRRDELPEVRKHGREGMDYRVEFQDGGPGGGIYADEPTAEGAWRNAVAWAGIAAYLREHPPVDEEQVKALADLMTEIDPNPHGWYTPDKPMLREMVQRGVRVATSDG